MIDRNGKTVISQTELSFPQTSRVDIRSVTADRSGNLYAGAEVWSKDQAAAGVICRLNADGQPALLIRTDDFLAVSLAVTPSGEVWAFGISLLLQTPRTSTSDYNTRLRFSNSGKLLGSLLPRSDFDEKIIPTHAYGDIGFPMMWASTDRVGIYSPTARRWVEFETQTSKMVTNIFITPPISGDGSAGAAFELGMLDSDDSVYMAFATNHFGPRQLSGRAAGLD